MKGLFFICVLFSLWPHQVKAQGMRPLSELLETDIEPSYPFIRCAAFYFANIKWAGEDMLGDAASDATRLRIHELTITASAIRQERSGGDLDHHFMNSARDASITADLYIARFKENYARDGQAFGADKLWHMDSALCQEIAQAVTEQLN